MSQYSRSERNANSGIVVGITPDDYPGGPLAGIAFQRRWKSVLSNWAAGITKRPGSWSAISSPAAHPRPWAR